MKNTIPAPSDWGLKIENFKTKNYGQMSTTLTPPRSVKREMFGNKEFLEAKDEELYFEHLAQSWINYFATKYPFLLQVDYLDLAEVTQINLERAFYVWVPLAGRDDMLKSANGFNYNPQGASFQYSPNANLSTEDRVGQSQVIELIAAAKLDLYEMKACDPDGGVDITFGGDFISHVNRLDELKNVIRIYDTYDTYLKDAMNLKINTVVLIQKYTPTNSSNLYAMAIPSTSPNVLPTLIKMIDLSKYMKDSYLGLSKYNSGEQIKTPQEFLDQYNTTGIEFVDIDGNTKWLVQPSKIKDLEAQGKTAIEWIAGQILTVQDGLGGTWEIRFTGQEFIRTQLGFKVEKISQPSLLALVGRIAELSGRDVPNTNSGSAAEWTKWFADTIGYNPLFDRAQLPNFVRLTTKVSNSNDPQAVWNVLDGLLNTPIVDPITANAPVFPVKLDGTVDYDTTENIEWDGVKKDSYGKFIELIFMSTMLGKHPTGDMETTSDFNDHRPAGIESTFHNIVKSSTVSPAYKFADGTSVNTQASAGYSKAQADKKLQEKVGIDDTMTLSIVPVKIPPTEQAAEISKLRQFRAKGKSFSINQEPNSRQGIGYFGSPKQITLPSLIKLEGNLGTFVEDMDGGKNIHSINLKFNFKRKNAVADQVRDLLMYKDTNGNFFLTNSPTVDAQNLIYLEGTIRGSDVSAPTTGTLETLKSFKEGLDTYSYTTDPWMIQTHSYLEIISDKTTSKDTIEIKGAFQLSYNDSKIYNDYIEMENIEIEINYFADKDYSFTVK